MQLYHFSEDPTITQFEPRPVPNSGSGQVGNLVWAVEAELEQNYLLPRDCPRVCFSAFPNSLPADIERLIGPTTARFVVAIESRWLLVVQATTLYRYELPPETFVPVDEGAAYFVSRQAVTPTTMRPIPDLLAALTALDVELRITPSLWPLCDAVAASSLRFSCIRMRNALPKL